MAGVVVAAGVAVGAGGCGGGGDVAALSTSLIPSAAPPVVLDVRAPVSAAVAGDLKFGCGAAKDE